MQTAILSILFLHEQSSFLNDKKSLESLTQPRSYYMIAYGYLFINHNWPRKVNCV